MKCANICQSSEGCKPSTRATDRQPHRMDTAGHALGQASGLGHGTQRTPHHSTTRSLPSKRTTNASTHQHTKAKVARSASAGAASRSRPTLPTPGVGGAASQARGGGGTRGGGAPHTQTARGRRVRNLSGRGGWQMGAVVLEIPAGVSPWWWCQRKNRGEHAKLFRRETEAVGRPRVVVLGDDLRYHAPRRWEVVG